MERLEKILTMIGNELNSQKIVEGSRKRAVAHDRSGSMKMRKMLAMKARREALEFQSDFYYFLLCQQ